ncbi:MAG: MBL fold metallo-hydrolase [Clostridiales bacterium]|nr:MBL fold metallo-hydrolase [Clostridiales bacterium]
MKLKVLLDNKTETVDVNAEWGLSVLIEADGLKIVYDLGTTDMVMDNAKVMNVNMEDVDAVAISHGHFDHTGGIPAFCKVNKKAKIYIHKNAFSVFHGKENGIIDDYNCGVIIPKQELERLEDRFVLTDGVTRLSDNILISGTIPDVPGIVPTETFYLEKDDGTIIEDDLRHEQFMVIRNGDKGLFIIDGCSHKGILPAIKYAQELFPGEKIQGILAGLHMYPAGAKEINSAIKNIEEYSPDVIMPLHCTGMKAICMFKQHFGDRCIIASGGDEYEF